ncbi:MAG: glycosyltransferase, partial [Sphingobacteriales bacterium]
MKTVFVTIPWFIPAFKAGGPIVSIANMVNELTDEYEFYIYTSNEDLHGFPIAVAVTNQWTTYNSYTKVWYAAKKDRSQNLVEQVKLLRPDSLFIVGVFDWHFNIVPMLYAECNDKIVSVRGMLHPGALQQKAIKKKIFLQAMKWIGLDKKCSFHATDAAEARYIKNILSADVRVHVAANFPRLFPKQELPVKTQGTLKLISIGIISPMKNYQLVLEALLRVRATVQYDIYGPIKEVVYWERCLETIKSLPANISVAYHPELPAHKVCNKLKGRHVFILPSKSENYGHAIVEALSAGLPVITSRCVPWVGLEECRAGINVEMEGKRETVSSLKLGIYG